MKRFFNKLSLFLVWTTIIYMVFPMAVLFGTLLFHFMLWIPVDPNIFLDVIDPSGSIMLRFIMLCSIVVGCLAAIKNETLLESFKAFKR